MILDKVFNNEKDENVYTDPTQPRFKRGVAFTKVMVRSFAEGWVIGVVAVAIVTIVVGAVSSDAEIEVPLDEV